MSIYYGTFCPEELYQSLVRLLDRICLFNDACGRDIMVVLEVVHRGDDGEETEHFVSKTLGGKPVGEHATLETMQEIMADCHDLDIFSDSLHIDMVAAVRGLAHAVYDYCAENPSASAALIVRTIAGDNSSAGCRRYIAGWVRPDHEGDDLSLLNLVNKHAVPGSMAF